MAKNKKTPKVLSQNIPAEKNTTSMLDGEILSQCQQEVEQSRSFIGDKVDQFQDRYRLYNDQRNTEARKNKVSTDITYNTMMTLLSVYHSDKRRVEFQPTKFIYAEKVENLNRLAEFDYNVMNLEAINYQKEWDRLFFGVGIRVFSHWDGSVMAPSVKVMNPAVWLPDPYADFTKDDARYQGFILQVTKGELEARDDLFNVADVLTSEDPDLSNDQDERRDNQALGVDDGRLPVYSGTVYDIIILYTHFPDKDGVLRKYKVTLANNKTLIIGFEELEPMTEMERKDPSKIEFPIVLNYYSPDRENPYGTSIPDKTEDKQRFKSVLFNLKIKREKAALYPMYVYDAMKILNPNDLSLELNKFVPVNGSTAGSVDVVNKSQNTFMTSAIERDLDDEANRSTGADFATQGVITSGERTAREVQAAQTNANLRFELHTAIDEMGDRKFWRYWRKMVLKNLGKKEKTVAYTTGINTASIIVSTKDILSGEDPIIKIVSKRKQEQQNKSMKLDFASTLPLILQDQTIPEISKMMAMRYQMKLNNVSDDKIAVFLPFSKDELQAMDENGLLSLGMDVRVEDDDDHYSHLIYHSQADRTKQTEAHILDHQMRMQAPEPAGEASAMLQNQGAIAQAQIGQQASRASDSTSLKPLVSNIGQ